MYQMGYQAICIRWAIRRMHQMGDVAFLYTSLPLPQSEPHMHKTQANEASVPECMHGAMKQKQAICAAMFGDELGMRIA